jgi:hypothetical protein
MQNYTHCHAAMTPKGIKTAHLSCHDHGPFDQGHTHDPGSSTITSNGKKGTAVERDGKGGKKGTRGKKGGGKLKIGKMTAGSIQHRHTGAVATASGFSAAVGIAVIGVAALRRSRKRPAVHDEEFEYINITEDQREDHEKTSLLAWA